MGKEILFGRWLLKNANDVFVENALCWKFEDTNFDTHELYEIFIERECGGKKYNTSTESVEVCEICNGSGVMKFDETDNAESRCVCKSQT